MTDVQYSISLKNFVSKLIGTPLFRLANEYFRNSKALELLLADKVLTENELELLKKQIQDDYDDGLIPERLKEVILTELSNLNVVI